MPDSPPPAPCQHPEAPCNECCSCFPAPDAAAIRRASDLAELVRSAKPMVLYCKEGARLEDGTLPFGTIDYYAMDDWLTKANAILLDLASAEPKEQSK